MSGYSDWDHSVSGELVLESLSFAIYDDLDKSVVGLICKFADELKVVDIVDNEGGGQKMQQNLDCLQIWM